MERRHLTTFNIAGFSYYDGPVVFHELGIGTELTLQHEPDNRYDPKAVLILYGEYKLGYIPRGPNNSISKFLEMGHNPFEVRIQRIDPAAHPEEQIGVIVYIRKNKSAVSSGKKKKKVKMQ